MLSQIVQVVLLIVGAGYWVRLNAADQERSRIEPKLNIQHPQTQTCVSVVIPARNEVQNLPRCLASLLAQDYIPEQIIVIDDNSTDGTDALVARYEQQDARVRLVRGQPLVTGWTGKSYALHQGVQEVKSDWILFVDADTCLDCRCLSSALAFCEAQNAHLLSLTSRQEAVTLSEQAVQPIVFGLLNHQYPLGIGGIAANGQFILVATAAYRAVGGHEAVRQEIVEDVALAQLFDRARYAVYFINGTALFSTRMYRNLAQLWEGWSKNSYALFVPQVGDTSAQLAVRFLPWASLLFVRDQILILNIVVLILGLVYDAQIRARQSFDPNTIWLQPMGALLTAAIIINSGIRTTLKLGTTWKGRSY